MIYMYSTLNLNFVAQTQTQTQNDIEWAEFSTNHLLSIE